MISTVQCQHCHKGFESEVGNQTEFCPYCGKETYVRLAQKIIPPPENKSNGIGVVILIVLVLAIGVALYFNVDPNTGRLPTSGPPAAASRPNVPVVLIYDVKGTVESYGGFSVSGILKNTSETDLAGVSVNYSLFDAHGNKVDVSMDFIDEIRAGEKWAFNVTSLKERIATYRLDSVTTIIDRARYELLADVK